MARYIRINAHCVFLLDASCEYLETARGEFARLSEGDYLCDSCSGWTETVRTPFHLVAPPETLEVTKLFPESLSISSCDLM